MLFLTKNGYSLLQMSTLATERLGDVARLLAGTAGENLGPVTLHSAIASGSCSASISLLVSS